MAYKIYGTNQMWNGSVIHLGNRIYTTVGGALEGNSYEVVEVKDNAGNRNTDENLPTMNPMNQQNTRVNRGGAAENPTIRQFNAPRNPRYVRRDTGALIPIGTQLHEHQDGTIMTGHNMAESSVVVLPRGTREVTAEAPAGRRTAATTTRTMTPRQGTGGNGAATTTRGTGGTGGTGGGMGGGY